MTLLRGNLSSGTNARGVLGFKGNDGDSAYDIAVKNGYEGTEQEWIEHFGLDLTNYLQTTDIVNNLTSESTTKPLSAASGKVIKTILDEKINTSKIANNLTTNDGNYVLSAAMGYTLKNNIDTLTTNTNTKIGTLTNLKTTEKTNVVGAINEVYTTSNAPLNYMIGGISANQTISEANIITRVNLNLDCGSNGDLLTLDTTNNCIVVGAGVHHLEVFGQVYIDTIGTAGVKNVYVYKNSNIMARGVANIQANYFTLPTGRSVISVDEGDIIYLAVMSNSTGTRLGASYTVAGCTTYLLVKVVD